MRTIIRKCRYCGKDLEVSPQFSLVQLTCGKCSEEPLSYLSRAELQYNIMKNIERDVLNMHKSNHLRWWWTHTKNWVKVQKYINSGTKKAGSTSSGLQCLFMGIDPDGFLIEEDK